jgi:tetratricopeptide (TPR) repeat protein
VLLTRLELFLRAHHLAPLQFARKAKYSRQYLVRLRRGQQFPTARSIKLLAATCAEEVGEPVRPEMLFERADELLRHGTYQLSTLHAPDLATLDRFLSEFHTSGWAEEVVASGVRSETAMRHLLFSGLGVIDVAPASAAEVLRAVLLMGSALPEGSPPEVVAALSAYALKGRANALRHLGYFDDALADLGVAARLFAEAKYCERESGQVEYVRATVLFKRERWNDALAAARASRRHFLAAKDPRRAAHAQIVEANVLIEQGATNQGRTLLHRLRRVLHELRDSEALPRVWLNLAVCEIRRGDEVEARRWLNRASKSFRQQRNTTELLRTRWNMATYISRFGKPARALALLGRVERSFLTLGMPADAGCVALDELDLMLDSGVSRAVLSAKARQAADAFAAAGMSVSLATALEELRRLHSSKNPRATLEEVRTAIRGIEEVPCPDVLTEQLETDEPTSP